MGKRVDGRALAKVKELERSGERNFGGKYNVMDTSKPACTITTQTHTSTGCFTIRRGAKYFSLGVEEAARLQSFTTSFRFCGSETSVRKQIGNSVPPFFRLPLGAWAAPCLTSMVLTSAWLCELVWTWRRLIFTRLSRTIPRGRHAQGPRKSSRASYKSRRRAACKQAGAAFCINFLRQVPFLIYPSDLSRLTLR